MSGIERIAAERKRQVEKEGWTHEHDDGHTAGELALAAACYATPILLYEKQDVANGTIFQDAWPWEQEADARPSVDRGNVIAANSKLSAKERIRQLEKAGALIAAEIDRLERKARAK